MAQARNKNGECNGNPERVEIACFADVVVNARLNLLDLEETDYSGKNFQERQIAAKAAPPSGINRVGHDIECATNIEPKRNKDDSNGGERRSEPKQSKRIATILLILVPQADEKDDAEPAKGDLERRIKTENKINTEKHEDEKCANFSPPNCGLEELRSAADTDRPACDEFRQHRR